MSSSTSPAKFIAAVSLRRRARVVEGSVPGVLLVHSQRRRPVRSLGRHSVKRCTRERTVPGGPEVPLDPAGEPGVAEAKVGELDLARVEKQLALRGEALQRPVPPAQGGVSV